MAFLAGFFTGIIFNSLVAQFLFQWIPVMLLTNVLAFLLIFVATYVIIKLVEKILGWIFKGEILKSLDRSLGFLLGLIEGVVIVALIVLLLNVQPWVDVEGLLQESIFNKILIGPLTQSVESFSQGIESNV
jgi:membrane protein required for colicin V production